MIEKYTKRLTEICRAVILEEEVSDIASVVEAASDINFFSFCMSHKLEGMVYEYLKRVGKDDVNVKAIAYFKDKYNQGILNNAAQQYYFEMVKNALEKNGIDYLPMKGMIMKTLYPSGDLRCSSDIDIYVGRENAERCKSIMENLGFINSSFGDLHPSDNYRIDKFSYIELHRKLINNKYKWQNECNKITDRIINKQGHEYVMSDEDFYIFMVCHIAKHVSFGGSGIRAVLDVWLYLQKFKNMDWNHINDILEKCDLTEFHQNLIKLTEYWFEDREADEKIKKLSIYIAKSGWNGIEEQFESAQVNEIAGIESSRTILKLKSYAHAMFMTREFMEDRYKILKKYPFLLPYFWGKRALNAVFNRRETIKNVLHSQDNVNLEKAQEINSFRKSLGL